jgi:hypothetical protein
MKNYICPICGYPELTAPAWDIKTGAPSFDICPCCGGEFGYNDANKQAKESYRKEWILGGANWFKPELKPSHWNLRDQLNRISVELNDLT